MKSAAGAKIAGVFTLGLAAVLAMAPISGCGGRRGPGASNGEAEHALVGATAPGFELPAQSGGGKVALAETSGKVVIVDFWATWCVPCRDSFPVYQRLVDKFGGQLVVIGVSVDEEPGGIAKFAADTGVKFDLVWDEGQVLSERYEPPTMPTSYILDKNGVVRFVHAGFKSGDDAKIESEVGSLVN
jgi:cytochrome c biogenesis protein CcmG, thiol:disulfide interchange protein DsbE